MLRSLIVSALLLLAGPALAQRQMSVVVDLATEVSGTYHGDVISDARGSSRSGVTVTVARVGPNLVEVSSDYRRVPTVRIRIERAMNAIVQADGDHVFLIQRDRDPNQLSLTIDDASLSVRKH
jgi:hypothetical protein